MLLYLTFIIIGAFLCFALLSFFPLQLTKRGRIIISFGAVLFALFSFAAIKVFPVWQAGLTVIVLMMAVSYLLEGRIASQLFFSLDEDEHIPIVEQRLPAATETGVEELVGDRFTGNKEEHLEDREAEEETMTASQSPLSITAREAVDTPLKEELLTNEVEVPDEDELDMDFLHKRVQEMGSLRDDTQKEMEADKQRELDRHYMSEIDELLFEVSPKQEEQKASEEMEGEVNAQEKQEETVKSPSPYYDYLNQETEDAWEDNDIIEIRSNNKKGEQ